MLEKIQLSIPPDVVKFVTFNSNNNYSRITIFINNFMEIGISNLRCFFYSHTHVLLRYTSIYSDQGEVKEFETMEKEME